MTTTPTNNDEATAWMKDVNETLDILTDDTSDLAKKVKTVMLIGGGAAALAALEGFAISVLFKGQKGIIQTLQAIVDRLEPAPMSPADMARAQALMDQARHPNVAVPEQPNGNVAPPVETPASESSEAVRAAMANDPDWSTLIPDLTTDKGEVNEGP